MRSKILLLCLVVSTVVSARGIPTSKIIAITDSILDSKVGTHLFPYFEVSKEGSHYNYVSNNKKMISELILDKRNIKKDFNEIWILYQFNYNKIEGMKSGIWIKLNANLQLLEEPNLNSVPNFLINELPCNFISKQKAKEIGEKLFFKKSNEISDPKLEYLKKIEGYIYSLANKSLKLNNGKKVVELEIVELDAYTGKLLNRYDSYNGLIEK